MKFKNKLTTTVEKVFKYSQVFRKYPLCHSRPDRSLNYKQRYFGLCARCTFMYLGGVLTIVSFPLWSNLLSNGAWLVIGSVAMTPAGLDGTTQMFTERESTNLLRLVTGLCLGIGITLIMWAVVQFSLNII